MDNMSSFHTFQTNRVQAAAQQAHQRNATRRKRSFQKVQASIIKQASKPSDYC